MSFASALNMDVSNEGVKITNCDQQCVIRDNNDLYCNVLLGIYVSNETYDITQIYLSSRNLGKQEFYNKSAGLYHWTTSNYHDHLDFNLTQKSNETFLKILNDKGDLIIQFSNDEHNNNRYDLFFNYTVKDFVIKDPVYNTLFFNLHGVPENISIQRTIIMPENSVIDTGSLYNFKIMAILGDGRRIVSVSQVGQAVLTYRDWNKEEEDRKKRDLSIIFISMSLSVFFSIFLSRKNQSKRTKNLWMSGCFFLLIVAMMLFFNLAGGIWNFILIISFISLFLFMGLAKSSDELDMRNVSIKRDIYYIMKMMKLNKAKSVLLIVSPVILLISWAQSSFVFIWISIALMFLAVFMKTN
jgi:hypothetical protein